MKLNPLVEVIIRETCGPEVAAQILDQVDAITPEQEMTAAMQSQMQPEDVLDYMEYLDTPEKIRASVVNLPEQVRQSMDRARRLDPTRR